MALKRKLDAADIDSAEPSHRPMKQLRVHAAQLSAVQSEDITMDDGAYESLGASASSLDSESPCYPTFNLYPFPSYEPDDVHMAGVNQSYINSSASESRTSSNASEESQASVGLMQPKTSFVHNISTCYQIPRLRVSCESGISGRRTLWTQCDQCGAIDMVDT